MAAKGMAAIKRANVKADVDRFPHRCGIHALEQACDGGLSTRSNLWVDSFSSQRTSGRSTRHCQRLRRGLVQAFLKPFELAPVGFFHSREDTLQLLVAERLRRLGQHAN